MPTSKIKIVWPSTIEIKGERGPAGSGMMHSVNLRSSTFALMILSLIVLRVGPSMEEVATLYPT